MSDMAGKAARVAVERSGRLPRYKADQFFSPPRPKLLLFSALSCRPPRRSLSITSPHRKSFGQDARLFAR